MSLARGRGVLRAGDARAEGVHPELLRRLVDAGELVRIGRGLYAAADHDPSEHFDLAHAAARVPRGVVCLLSALSYHGIGMQLPHEVWMMIDRRAHRPARTGRPSLRIILGSGRALTAGVEPVEIDGRAVPVFSPAKTVVDCFRYRRHVGTDVAVEALRETLRDRRATPAEIGEMARLCRVGTIVRPYLEALA